MKLLFKLFLLITLSLVFALETNSLSNTQIFNICTRKRRKKACIRKLKLNRELIYRGKPIEVPVYPYKSK